MATVSHEGTSRRQSSCSNPHEAGASYSRLVPKKIIMSLGRPFFSPLFFLFFFSLPPPSLAIKYIGQLEMEESLFKNNVFFFPSTHPRGEPFTLSFTILEDPDSRIHLSRLVRPWPSLRISLTMGDRCPPRVSTSPARPTRPTKRPSPKRHFIWASVSGQADRARLRPRQPDFVWKDPDTHPIRRVRCGR